MVIEMLQVRVPIGDQARYIAADTAIWTAALAQNPGYLGKEIWSPENDPELLHLVIRWSSRSAWQAVPQDLLARTEAQFRSAMGRGYPVINCTAYDVRKPT